MEASQKGVYMPEICILGIQPTSDDLPKRASFWHSGPSNVISDRHRLQIQDFSGSWVSFFIPLSRGYYNLKPSPSYWLNLSTFL